MNFQKWKRFSGSPGISNAILRFRKSPYVRSYQNKNLNYNQKLCTVKWFLARELPLFCRIMKSGYRLKELRQRKVTLRRVKKFWLMKGALVPWEFLELTCLFVLQKF